MRYNDTPKVIKRIISTINTYPIFLVFTHKCMSVIVSLYHAIQRYTQGY